MKKNGHMDMQIIVTGALAKKYKWITKLTDRVERVDLNDLLDEIEKLTDERIPEVVPQQTRSHSVSGLTVLNSHFVFVKCRRLLQGLLVETVHYFQRNVRN